jgi:hypothetical protein
MAQVSYVLFLLGNRSTTFRIPRSCRLPWPDRTNSSIAPPLTARLSQRVAGRLHTSPFNEMLLLSARTVPPGREPLLSALAVMSETVAVDGPTTAPHGAWRRTGGPGVGPWSPYRHAR